eukprot:jgi/Mesvir1/695/Mv17307-RA.1
MASAVFSRALAHPRGRCEASSEHPDKWVCVGRRPTGPKVTKIYNEEILLYNHRERDETLAVRNACPHRGARLSHNCHVEDGCVRCAYHGKYWGKQNNGDNYLEAKDDSELVWVNAGFGDGASPPPTMPEFSEPGYRTFSYSTFVHGHPMIVMENLLDHAHLQYVHKVKIVDVKSTDVTADKEGDKAENQRTGKSVYSYPVKNELVGRLILGLMPEQGRVAKPPPRGSLMISVDNEFYLPYTASLRFRITGHENPVFVLWFSVQPYEADKSRVTCRVSRNILTDPAWDFLFWLVNALPLKEDDDIVANVVTEEWWRNRLTPDDAFVRLYRKRMKNVYGISCPEPFA